MGRDCEAFNSEQKTSPTDSGDKEGVLRQCDNTYPNPVEVRPVKKCNHSNERKEERIRNEEPIKFGLRLRTRRGDV